MRCWKMKYQIIITITNTGLKGVYSKNKSVMFGYCSSCYIWQVAYGGSERHSQEECVGASTLFGEVLVRETFTNFVKLCQSFSHQRFQNSSIHVIIITVKLFQNLSGSIKICKKLKLKIAIRKFISQNIFEFSMGKSLANKFLQFFK